ncbi:hypothetical protein FHX15_004370 [Rhizobium sp. BK650]|uniref:hypothetical protein n=1 Tax=Rhizobium sp. BK650 TaxID=2586990 RepID=UPI001621A077|nr:hypothetical protein [Rhizobium sp. BK650]MBB3659106.1 hypothetical protein [Rhizobium sp. BK650]
MSTETALSVGLLERLVQPRTRSHRIVEWVVLAVWFVAVGLQVFHHVMFRDEVRALTLALSGDSIWAMLRTIHGEGHPAVWYLLLRVAHLIFGSVEVLPGLALLVATAAVILLLFRSPFPLILVILIIGSDALAYEYSVMARNYGISALLLFVIAANYQAWRTRGYLIGGLLFLLANTNVIAAIMTGGFLLFWFLDLLEDRAMRSFRSLTNFFVNAVIATAGLVVCGITILPTFNDAAVADLSMTSPVELALNALVNPASTTPGALFPTVPIPIGSLVLFGSTLGLLARPAAFVGAVVALVVFSLFSNLASAGDERHALVWFCFCLSLYWISWDRIADCFAGEKAMRSSALVRFGCGLLGIMVGLQALLGFTRGAHAIGVGRVESRSADLARLIRSSPELAKATIVAEPEYLAEALSYYIDNPIYLIREHKFGTYVRFTKKGKLDTDLGETLTISQDLRTQTALPVVILMQHKLKKIVPGEIYREGYNWTFHASRQQIDDFLSATTLLAEFGPANYFETYDVYLLK